MQTNDLKYYSKYELQTMHRNAKIDWCPSCNRYHVKQKPRWPLYNISRCDKCSEIKIIVDNMLDNV